ncbi:putative endoplasmic reticulum membrane protein C16E8.02 [Colletotrichum liriopes]|uniref:Endoplasmic reticulum membrane protein C16E8.02 n=1 Tax=Colletotrichum liriopes TaxID=708192 RepID=A0AA37GG71_9PEZI|nr:putative endoplasmic reticulum membrane protein C16E8.02 [Colletotrichum liriopes]
MSLDLEKHLTFYGAYHHNTVNIGIHMACVPMILFSGFCLATNTGTLIPLPSWLTVPNLELNLGTLAALTWGGLYVLLEPVAGTLLAIICLAATAAGNSFRLQNPALTNQAAIGVHIACWIFQFIGHGAFEGRCLPRPLFVWLEFLFKLGYRQELKGRVDKAVEKEIAKFRASKANGEAKNGKAQ